MGAIGAAMDTPSKPPTDHVAGMAYGNVGGRGGSSAIPFDPYRRAADPELAAAVTALALDLERQELAGRLRIRQRSPEPRVKFRLAVEALACNLLVAQCLASGRPLAIHKGSGAMWGLPRYTAPVYGQPFLDALDLMAHPEVGLIANLQKGYKYAGKGGRLSTIAATPRLLESLCAARVDWSSFGREPECEVLVLKATKIGKGSAEEVDFRETGKTRRLRRAVVRLNGWLAAAPLTITDTSALGFSNEGFLIDPTRRTVRRIFNNGKWDEGGRLYGGFWEVMPRAERFRLLRIRGEPVANVDYGTAIPPTGLREGRKARA